jgi:BirA family biotin operon repressor/biotin-[acetyl-CoA-carboxylase] ligase
MLLGVDRQPLDLADLTNRVAVTGQLWRRIEIVEETGSTNADLLAVAAAGESIDGRVLVADYQSAGRGRHGRTWTAPPRSQLAMSVGVDATGVPPSAWGWLPLLTGVAVADAVRAECGVVAGLKWPNDVLIGPNKLAGILAEVAAPAPAIVVGLGLNVTLTAAEAPDLAAVSLLTAGAPDVERSSLAANVLRHLGRRIEAWRSAGGADAALVADYRALSVTLGTRVRGALPGDKELVGVARDIDELGRLLIESETGLETVSAGDITHLRPLDDTGRG